MRITMGLTKARFIMVPVKAQRQRRQHLVERNTDQPDMIVFQVTVNACLHMLYNSPEKFDLYIRIIGFGIKKNQH